MVAVVVWVAPMRASMRDFAEPDESWFVRGERAVARASVVCSPLMQMGHVFAGFLRFSLSLVVLLLDVTLWLVFFDAGCGVTELASQDFEKERHKNKRRVVRMRTLFDKT
jgi:hypothetical protein